MKYAFIASTLGGSGILAMASAANKTTPESFSYLLAYVGIVFVMGMALDALLSWRKDG